jgi:hypothetical protein
MNERLQNPLLALAAVLVVTPPVTSQIAPSAGLGMTWRTAAPGSNVPSFRIDPGLSLWRAGVRLRMEGIVIVDPTLRIDGSRADATIPVGELRRVQFEIAGDLLDRRAGTTWHGDLRARWARPTLGAWVGAGAWRADRPGTSVVPTVSTGGWARTGRLQLSVLIEQATTSAGTVLDTTFSPPADTVSPPPYTPPPRRSLSPWSSAQLWATWAGGNVDVQASAGVASADLLRARRWAEAQMRVWVSPRVAVAVGGGVRGMRPLSLGAPGQRYVVFGVRVAAPARPFAAPAVPAPAPLRLRVLPGADGARIVEVRAPGVARVELMADFTDWSLRALTHQGGDRWSTTLAIPAGVHQVCIRIDGGPCVPPPGLPTARDGYAGLVGVLVIE